MILAQGTIPEVVFPLLDALYVRNRIEAERIEDRYSIVLKGIREDEIKDRQMVDEMFTVLGEALQRYAPEGTMFARYSTGRHGMAWGYWPSGR